MTEIEQYHHAISAIFSMAVAEQKEINASPHHDTERIKAFRIALAFLRPDLGNDEICNEIERVSHYEWDAERRNIHNEMRSLHDCPVHSGASKHNHLVKKREPYGSLFLSLYLPYSQHEHRIFITH